ncbi:D-glycero-alpha-D-manno-heptose-7-phosphate kinase [Anaerobacterium chartisolvens]|uniref:D-glycero-alpha-D-manno-heptose-7-phosphate kinase n=1 Tax=Anaerobacterium chartisolvens TaxID=1297424 RepID=A0A369AU46_9FIRM|nr:GHMP kinase [Anaerobacterium chartisolvens]RCX12543.1 D-glycero-alpha-D-manno-heptose-7-phosphate kinase [Anaerobacterium chartisolvens]
MVICRTPLRVSLFGGGTDIEAFWCEEDGCVLSSTINKYIYVIVKKSFDKLMHIKYFREEVVEAVRDIKHDLIREAMYKTGVTEGIDIAVLSDIPHTGSGLGSSGSLTVGLLNALYTYAGAPSPSLSTLAQQACEIEISILNKPVGKQDQYIAAYGGLNVIEFKCDGCVEVKPVTLQYNICRELKKNLLLFYTGMGHKAEDILKEQGRLVVNTRPVLQKMKRQVYDALDIMSKADVDRLGLLMKEGWSMKRQLTDKISNGSIDGMIERAFKAGASGAKITGAGGGGFLLVFCSPSCREAVRSTMRDLIELDFDFEKSGTQILVND